MFFFGPTAHDEPSEVEHAHEHVNGFEVMWGTSTLGHIFLVVAVIAFAALLGVIVRSRVGRWIAAEVFIGQIRKLIAAGNLDRAIKLTRAADVAVTVVARAGLEAASSAGQSTDRYAPSPIEAAQQAMMAARAAAHADNTSGFLAARILGAAACLLAGGAVATNDHESAMAATISAAVIALLLIMTWLTERAHAQALDYTMAAISDVVSRIPSQ